jgi:hypothetical protein
MSAFQVDLSKTSLFSHRLCIMTSVDTMEEVLRRLGKFHKQFMKDFSWTENSERGKAKMGSFFYINATVAFWVFCILRFCTK